MNVKQLVNFLDRKFPFINQEDWDNVKVNTKSFFSHKIERVLIGLDLNFSAIKLAISNGCNVIITHHPIYINPDDIRLEYIQKLRKTLSKNKITHIPLHTNYDISNNSMSFQLCEKIAVSKPTRAFEKSYGWIASFDGTVDELANCIRRKWGVDYILTTSPSKGQIKNFYFCSGACSSEVEYLLHTNNTIDVYITGEIKWNVWNLGNDMEKILIDVGHNVEAFFIGDIGNMMTKKKLPIIETSQRMKIRSF